MIPASVRIFVCTEPQDMRRGFDALALTVRQVIGEDPRGGAVFVFASRRSDRVKVLWWDRNGYCLMYKRLHRALFRVPAADEPAQRSVVVDPKGFAELLRGVERTSRREGRNRS
ncbi:IS66 family insertion sequence element accessory protein TnpB [Nannocystis punicea]|uniref:IS66 family insertion sequence element accessory protein TnpB n=1 Tax=Nannocystis punicea TaxID=2995304 RepID=A0ABY7GY97_9BACT|nr:IS66 family insertion sequence element accessory protein TnpB [Nannocystis poenicansa]WAS90525.1 IS66 family insertion sequence element accessory protein TnpB [Nannocystis poenicansa]WAS91849.1 IS66 family insertion sequence element accessory protein TnpB [Nannocystis poenicansa]WAS91913.1 IS66 family insertion sequence element accessory protein TnpB [Nannocystis poenicansa]